MEIIKGIVENVKPKLVIVIDSLSSKSIESFAMMKNKHIF